MSSKIFPPVYQSEKQNGKFSENHKVSGMTTKPVTQEVQLDLFKLIQVALCNPGFSAFFI